MSSAISYTLHSATHLKPLLALALASLSLPSLLDAETTDVVQKTFELREGSAIQIRTEQTDVSVTGWDRPNVEIVLTRKIEAGGQEKEMEILAGELVTVEQDGNKIVVELEVKENSRAKASRDYALVVRTPASVSADIKNSAGPIYVRGLSGSVKVKSAAGEISLRDITGSIDADVSGSGISARDTQGTASLRASGSGIRVDRHQGVLTLHSSGGGLAITGLQGSVRARTTGGPIEAQFSSSPEKASELHATGGSIELSLPADVSTTISATATGGDIETDFTLEAPTKGGIRTTVRGKINGGGPTLTLRSTGGNINIRKQ